MAGIIPAMVQRGYHSRPAKTVAWGEGHIDQPLLVHIQNGVFGLLQVLALLEKKGIRLVDEAGLRRAIVMYVTHDLHKMTEYAVSQDAGRSQFDQALEDYQAEIQALGLDKFADTVPAMHRAAAVSLCSPKTGDLSACPPGTALLVDLVHLADCMASMTHCQQTSVLANRLQKLLPPGRAHRYAFYYHRLDDLKGLFTNLLHRAVSQVLEENYGLYPLLYFADSTLYLGPVDRHLPVRGALLPLVEQEIFHLLLQQPPPDLSEAFDTLNIKVQSYAFLFLDAAGISALLRQYAASNAQPGFWRKTLEKHIKDYTLSQEELHRQLGMPPGWDDDITRNQAVFSTARYLAAAKRLWERLQPGADGLAELTRLLGLPAEELELVRRCIPDKYSKDKTYDDCIALAWRWLAGFSAAGRSGFSMPVDMLLNHLERTFLSAWQSMLTTQRRQELVEHELALRSGLAAYLAEHLFFSCKNACSAWMVAIPVIWPAGGRNWRRNFPVWPICWWMSCF
ncbi:MAG: type I-D CRISPR-associated protein Cas10d/Csc3 [Desulfurispora sp.]|uniref:type I-D CRISPR-associated protein Cas10d/Csc3 n=1 Tax=Desulfurispora sp. TaxID=3014275 RepID=UPI004049534C